MSIITAVLFDLDGTLTDPADGITRCIQHALDRLGRPLAPGTDLRIYIGPPLRQSFATLLQTQDTMLVERAMALYRERFGTVGLFENRPYDGVREMLADLRQRGVQIFVATSKPRVYAERIMAHFTLDSYVTGIYGSELDGRYDHKGDLLACLIRRERLSVQRTVMVGDREHDINAARQHAMRSIGVTYGYGAVDELLRAGADRLCATPEEVARSICAAGAAGAWWQVEAGSI